MPTCNCTSQEPAPDCPYGTYLFQHIAGHYTMILSPEFLLLLQDAKEAIHKSYAFWIQQYNQHVQRSMINKAISQQETIQHPLRTPLRNQVRLK